MSELPGSYTPTIEEQAEYQKRYVEAEKAEAKVPPVLAPDGSGREVIWRPLKGGQTVFLNCPIFEALFEGTRGPGKTDALIMCYAQHVGKGWGAAWRGIIFRQTYPQLADVVAKTKKWFRLIFGNSAKFNEAAMVWRWDSGETLSLRHMRKPDDYWNYHGHEYPFIGWEELTNWPDDQCFKAMFACCRSSTLGVPRMVRSTTNPYGVGHNWVKDRYRLPEWRFKPILDAKDIDGRPEPARIAIHGHIRENTILLKANPDYINVIAAAARNDAEKEAWLNGSWDVVAGGMFDDVWFKYKRWIVVEPFVIPRSWYINRSFDWGSAAPFSVGWWAESDGTDVRLANGKVMSTVRGDLFRIAEWYGSNGRPNEGLRLLANQITAGIIEREIAWGWYGRVKPGPADSSIFDDENGMCIARDMAASVKVNGQIYRGVVWEKADKSPGSIENGCEMMRKMFAATDRSKGPREAPGLHVFRTCTSFLKFVPPAPRDEKHINRIAKEWEDHVIDETRYRVRQPKRLVRSGGVSGLL